MLTADPSKQLDKVTFRCGGCGQSFPRKCRYLHQGEFRSGECKTLLAAAIPLPKEKSSLPFNDFTKIPNSFYLDRTLNPCQQREVCRRASFFADGGEYANSFSHEELVDWDHVD